jgi:hypothetical protein
VVDLTFAVIVMFIVLVLAVVDALTVIIVFALTVVIFKFILDATEIGPEGALNHGRARQDNLRAPRRVKVQLALLVGEEILNRELAAGVVHINALV